MLNNDKVYEIVFLTFIIIFTVSLTTGLLSLYFHDSRLLMLSFYVLLIGVAPIGLYTITVKLRELIDDE